MLPTEPDQPDIRVSDAERNKVVDLLREQCSEGRLTLEEFSDRVGGVFNARTRRELDAAVADLPIPVEYDPLPSTPQPAPSSTPEKRRPIRKWVVGIWGGGKVRGRWRPAEETHVLALMGGCEIDLRNAEIDGDDVVIKAYAIMGGIDIIVPEGIEVEMDGFSLMGGNDRRVKDVPRLPGTPTVRVWAFSMMGGVCVKSRAQGESRREKLERALELAAEKMQHRLPAPPASPMPATIPAPATTFSGNGNSAGAVNGVTAPGGTVTILFSDIEGFTEMTE